MWNEINMLGITGSSGDACRAVQRLMMMEDTQKVGEGTKKRNPPKGFTNGRWAERERSWHLEGKWKWGSVDAAARTVQRGYWLIPCAGPWKQMTGWDSWSIAYSFDGWRLGFLRGIALLRPHLKRRGKRKRMPAIDRELLGPIYC